MKRFLSLILVVVMMMSLVPSESFAAEDACDTDVVCEDCDHDQNHDDRICEDCTTGVQTEVLAETAEKIEPEVESNKKEDAAHKETPDALKVVEAIVVSTEKLCDSEGNKTQIPVEGELHITVGETLQLRTAIQPEDATDKTVTWLVDDDEILSVNADGLVTSIAAGNAVITASANDGSGVKADFSIVVAEKENEVQTDNAEEAIGENNALSDIVTLSTTFNAVNAESWLWPVASCKRISSNFGMRDVDSNGTFEDAHSGIDIGCSMGTAVRASKSGTVISAANCYGNDQHIESSDMSSYGNYVGIKNDDGTYSIYAHLSNYSMVTSGHVNQGDTIGYSGNSGWSDGAHLHFQCSTNISNGWSYAANLINTMPTDSCCTQNGISVVNPYVARGDASSTRMEYVFTPGGNTGSFTDAYISSADSTGYTVTVKTTGAMSIRMASWTETNNQDDVLWRDLTTSGTNQYSYTVKFADHNDTAIDNYYNHIYTGNTFLTSVYYNKNDLIKPKISDVSVKSDGQGYTVSCKVETSADLDRVLFPTWSVANWQDDLASNWETSSVVKGTVTQESSTGTKKYAVSFRLNIADHNNETGLYCTHIYAYDVHGRAYCINIGYNLAGPTTPTKTVIYNGSRYELYDTYTNYSWDEANYFCERLGGHLATITSAGENAAIADLVSYASSNITHLWLGATDSQSEGTWKWVTGEAFSYTNWTQGNPDNSGGNENYLEFVRESNKWNDINTRVGGGIICEYENVKFTISFDANGGLNAPANQTKTGGTALKLTTSVPTRSGYKFVGWALSKTATVADYQSGANFSTDADTTLYAVWKKLYTISYDANGGTGAPAAQTLVDGGSVVLSSAAPQKTDSIFLGWATSKTATKPEYLAGVTYKKNADLKLYAVWLEKACYAETNWSEWSATKPTGVSESMTDSKVQYRYRDKSTKTSTTESSISGWTPDGTKISWSEYGAWSEWSETAVTASDAVQVETATIYRYYRARCPQCGATYGYSNVCSCPCNIVWDVIWKPVPYTQSKYISINNEKAYSTSLGDGAKWYFSLGNLNQTAVGTVDACSSSVVIAQGYRSRTRTSTTTYYFYKWSAWSAWSDTTATSASTREIETRTLYRYCTQTAYEHSWDSGVVTKVASCKEEGVKTFTCSHCKKTKTETIAKTTTHTFGDWKVTKAATCKEEGTETRTCSVCGATETRSIAKTTTHTWGSWQTTKAATCKETGTKTRTCSVCGKVESETIAKITTHTWGDWVVTKAATCEENGTKERTCSVCEKVETGTIPVTSTHNHTHIAAKDATTEAEGNIEYWKCSDCEKYFSDSEGKNEITLSQTVIPKVNPDAMQITVSGGQVALNNEITVTVSLSNNPGIAAIMANIVYDDTKLTLMSATARISEGSWVEPENIAETGEFMWFSLGDDYTGNGNILTLVFKANADAAIGDTTVSIAFDKEFGGVSNSAEEAVAYAVNAGTINISNRKPGDINGDNKVNINDVIRLAQYVKAKGKGVDVVSGSTDTNGDGKTNVNDVIRLAQYVKGKGIGVVIN